MRVSLPGQDILCTSPSWNSSSSVLAEQNLTLILLPRSLLGNMQATHVKEGMKMKALHMLPFYSVKVGDNQAVTCQGWPSSGVKREVLLLPVLWVDKTSSSPLSFLLFLISLLAVTCHKSSRCNVCLWYGENNRSFAWNGLAWQLSRGVLDLNTKIPIWEHWQGSVCCSSSMQQNCLFYLAFLSLLERNLFCYTWQHQGYSTACLA